MRPFYNIINGLKNRLHSPWQQTNGPATLPCWFPNHIRFLKSKARRGPQGGGLWLPDVTL
jgi:hypothetical protein